MAADLHIHIVEGITTQEIIVSVLRKHLISRKVAEEIAKEIERVLEDQTR
jgi:hypothetical protein